MKCSIAPEQTGWERLAGAVANLGKNYMDQGAVSGDRSQACPVWRKVRADRSAKIAACQWKERVDLSEDGDILPIAAAPLRLMDLGLIRGGRKGWIPNPFGLACRRSEMVMTRRSHCGPLVDE